RRQVEVSMLFNRPLFVFFIFLFFVVYKFAARTRPQRLWCITIASATFYGAWDYRFIPLLFGTALLDFYVARAIDRSPRELTRKRLLFLSIAVNLGVLAFFKYTNFFLTSSQSVLGLFGFTMDVP